MAQNIYNPKTGQRGYQIPGSALQTGWQWDTGGAPAAPIPVTPTAPSSYGSLYDAATAEAQKAAKLIGGSYSPGAGYTPPTPTSPAPSTPATTPTTPNLSNGTDNEVLQAILDFKKTLNESNEAVTKAQTDVDAFDESKRTSFRNIEGQPIAMPFVTGQQAGWEKTYGDQGIALQNKLANIQTKRVADISSGSTNIDLLMKEREYQTGLNKPVTVGSGSSLVDPTTGQSIYTNKEAGGAGAAGIQEFNLAQEQGFSGSYLDFLNAKKYVTATGKVITDPLTGKQMIINPVSNISGVSTSGAVSGGTTLGTGAAGSVSLDVGSRGDSVTQLQSFLNSKGYSTAPDAPGVYGQGTQSAVAQFQKATGVDTSGGGVGTFGPRTQAAASGMGFALSGGGQTGDLSAIPAEIRASISDIGGLQFIDQSKLKSTQLPTAQRISEQYGIPLLSAAQSTAIRDASSAYSSATSIVNQIASTGQGLFTAGSIPDAVAMGPALSAQAAIKGTNANLYKSGVDSLLSILTRAAGEKVCSLPKMCRELKMPFRCSVGLVLIRPKAQNKNSQICKPCSIRYSPAHLLPTLAVAQNLTLVLVAEMLNINHT